MTPMDDAMSAIEALIEVTERDLQARKGRGGMDEIQAQVCGIRRQALLDAYRAVVRVEFEHNRKAKPGIVPDESMQPEKEG